MYLIKVELDRGSREARKLLADCQQMHRFVTGLLGADRRSAQALYRTNLTGNRLSLYLYAQKPIEACPAYCEVLQRDVTAWLEGMETGQYWNFDLIASPSKKAAAEGQKNSRRRVLRDPEQRQAWLARKAEQSGFRILHGQELEQVHVSGRHSLQRGGEMFHDAYHYQGTLQITDAVQFRSALQQGIGSGKAYGFGMLMVKNV